MRKVLKSTAGWSASGWFWLVALLVLPNCTPFGAGPRPPDNLNPGAKPLASAVFCDIEVSGSRRCATAEDLATGVPLSAAAVALATGRRSIVGIDESPAARAACGGGNPQAVTFRASFPDGDLVCLNCGVIPSPYADAKAVCVARCLDTFSTSGRNSPPSAESVGFCNATARASTNFLPLTACFGDVCTDAGVLRDGFVDPRRTPEPVAWTDTIGVNVLGNNLTKTAPTVGENFDAGATSSQWITRGDAYVEFSAFEDDLSHVIGLAQIPSGCTFPCPDADPSLADIDFAVSLNRDGNFYVLENGNIIDGGGAAMQFGTYKPGDRFRVSLRDRSDGTATVTYSRIIGACVTGAPCPEAPFFTHTATTARYPFRVDTAFRETGATLTDVRMVRIQ